VPPERLSRLVSHALRHEPWLYELELDAGGWTSIAGLLAAVHEQGPPWSEVERRDLVDMIASSAKQRHEIEGDRIRALYGHSVPGRIVRVAATPPKRLFHGTSPTAWAEIQRDGLRPMGRQYVHLSGDLATAEQVGRRKSSTPLIVFVDAGRASDDGIRFWRGNEIIWLADAVPPDYLVLAGEIGSKNDRRSAGGAEGGADAGVGE
jgi:putative RNA 2'-phosphotransferase